MGTHLIHDLIVVGGGASGVFAAITAKTFHPGASVHILEKTKSLLSKVRLSGGGRCNVTNACFDLTHLIRNYPRGSKELLGLFHAFQPKDMMAWLENHGVRLKVEANGRVFPVSNASETIINCLVTQLEKLHISVQYDVDITSIAKETSLFRITCPNSSFFCHNLLLATGSGSEGYDIAKKLGHTLIQPVPSLFPISIAPFPLHELSGVAADPVEVSIHGTHVRAEGSLLITHTGFSGPVILELSSKAARYLYENKYKATIAINWLPGLSQKDIFEGLLHSDCSFLPKSLRKKLFGAIFKEEKKNPSLKELRVLAEKLHKDLYQMQSRSPSEGEFVTCGGVALREVDFRTMESKITPRLFFAGEILDIDGFTGGFNLQNAWTTGFKMGSTHRLLSVSKDV